MTDTSGGATNPFAGLAASMGANGGAVDPRLSDPEFFMRYSEVGKFANQVASHGQALSDTSAAIKNIHLPMGTFGVIGGGLNGVHSKLRDQAADAMAKGKGVLDSWKLALDKAVENAKEGEKESSGKTGKGGLNGLGGGTKGAGIDPKKLGLGGGGLPKTGPSGLGNDWKLPKDKLGTDLDDSLKHPDLPDPSTLPGPGGKGGDLPSPGDPNGANGNGLGGSGLDPNGLNGNGIGRTGLDGLDRNAPNPQAPAVPGDTALSAHTPAPPTVPTLPDLGTSGYGRPTTPREPGQAPAAPARAGTARVATARVATARARPPVMKAPAAAASEPAGCPGCRTPPWRARETTGRTRTATGGPRCRRTRAPGSAKKTWRPPSSACRRRTRRWQTWRRAGSSRAPAWPPRRRASKGRDGRWRGC